MLPPEKERHYPQIRSHGYKVSSDTTEHKSQKYNCVAFAAGGDTKFWWEGSTFNSKPVKKPGRFWPDGIDTDDSIETYVKVFESVGYSVYKGKIEDCVKFELFCEKIIIYGYPEQAFSHVSYQLYFGWIAKLGDWEDVKHKTFNALEGEYYGNVMVVMKRTCKLRGFLFRAFPNLIAKFWPVSGEECLKS